MNIKYQSVDLFILICALMVAAIHVSPTNSLGEVLDFYIVDVLARIAVPFFYASAGFFLFRKMEFVDGKLVTSAGNIGALKRYVKRISLMYLGWSAVYLLW